MLARTYKTAAQLGITQNVLDALEMTQRLLEDGEIKPFGMRNRGMMFHFRYAQLSEISPDAQDAARVTLARGSRDPGVERVAREGWCGTIGCVGAWVAHFAAEPELMHEVSGGHPLHGLFYGWPEEARTPDGLTDTALAARRIDDFRRGLPVGGQEYRPLSALR